MATTRGEYVMSESSSYLEQLKQSVAWTLSVDTAFDFRTPTSLAQELAKPESDIRWALYALRRNGSVRNPIVADKQYDDWWRWAARGLTRREKWARLRAYVANDFYALREDAR